MLGARALVPGWDVPARIAELSQFRSWTSALVVRRLKGLVRAGLPLLYRLYVDRMTRAQPGTEQT